MYRRNLVRYEEDGTKQSNHRWGDTCYPDEATALSIGGDSDVEGWEVEVNECLSPTSCLSPKYGGDAPDIQLSGPGDVDEDVDVDADIDEVDEDAGDAVDDEDEDDG